MKAYVKLSELKARLWPYSVIQSFCVSNPTFKNGALVVLFPLYTYIRSMDLTIVSLVGITTLRAETMVWSYELMTAPSYIHTKRCSHASLLARSSAYMTKWGHMLAHMPLYTSISL